jgi:hypothetical protein
VLSDIVRRFPLFSFPGSGGKSPLGFCVVNSCLTLLVLCLRENQPRLSILLKLALASWWTSRHCISPVIFCLGYWFPIRFSTGKCLSEKPVYIYIYIFFFSQDSFNEYTKKSPAQVLVK